jgi:hypothetical protein
MWPRHHVGGPAPAATLEPLLLSRSEHRGRDGGAVRAIVRRDAVQDEVCAYLFQSNIFSTWLNKNKNITWSITCMSV